MPFTTTKINNFVVHAAPKMGGEDTRPPRGEKLFSNPFANIYLSAKKNSGKTSNIFFILKRIMGRRTKLIVFCSTVHRDDSWRYIIDYFEQKGIEIEVHTSLREGKQDLLAQLVARLENEFEPTEKQKAKEPPKPAEILKQKGNGAMRAILMHNLPPEITGEGEEKKPKKSKFKEREYVVVFDDLSTELKSPSLIGLLKKNRHFKMTCLLSSQYYLDIKPESRQMIDYFLLYKGITEEKLEAMYKDANLAIEEKEFMEMYHQATEKPYSFLYVGARDDQFRECYDKQIEI